MQGLLGKGWEEAKGILEVAPSPLVAPKCCPLPRHWHILPSAVSPVCPTLAHYAQLGLGPLSCVITEREELASVRYQRSQVWPGCPRLTADSHASQAHYVSQLPPRAPEGRTQLHKAQVWGLGLQFLDAAGSGFFFTLVFLDPPDLVLCILWPSKPRHSLPGHGHCKGGGHPWFLPSSLPSVSLARLFLPEAPCLLPVTADIPHQSLACRHIPLSLALIFMYPCLCFLFL